MARSDADRQMDLLQGTLDMLILKAVSLGPLHGYGVLLRIQQISGEELVIQQGSLYPALYRLEHQGAIASSWGESENNRRAKYYRLTSRRPRPAGSGDGEVESDGRDHRQHSAHEAGGSMSLRSSITRLIRTASLVAARDCASRSAGR